MTKDAQDEAEITKLEAKLWRPPTGEEPAGIWSAEAEMDLFRSLKDSLARE